jgi:hypothetical protein
MGVEVARMCAGDKQCCVFVLRGRLFFLAFSLLSASPPAMVCVHAGLLGLDLQAYSYYSPKMSISKSLSSVMDVD